MAAFGAQRELKRVGGRELQRRVARDERCERTSGCGLRQALRAISGEGVEIENRGVGGDQAGPHPTPNKGEELGCRPIADANRLMNAREPREGSIRCASAKNIETRTFVSRQ